MDAGSSTLLPDRDKSLIPSHEHVDSDHGLYEYKHGLSSHIMVAGRLKTHIQFWKSTGTSPYILNLIKSGYRIPLYSMPPVSFSNNNTSASANKASLQMQYLNCYSLIIFLKRMLCLIA